METSLQKNTGANGRATVPLRMFSERAERWEGGRGGSIAQPRDYGGLQGTRFCGGRTVRQGEPLPMGNFGWRRRLNSQLPFTFQLIHTLHHHVASGELRLFHQRDDFTVLYVGQRVFQQCRGHF